MDFFPFSVGGVAVTYSRYEYESVAVSFMKRLRDDRFNSETTVRRFQKQNRHLAPGSRFLLWFKILSAGTSRKESSIGIIVFQGGGGGRVYRNVYVYEIPQGPIFTFTLKERHCLL
jgi:hypothetical protein